MQLKNGKFFRYLIPALVLIVVVYIFDAAIMKALQSDTPRAQAVSRAGYWLGHGNVVIPVLVGILALAWLLSFTKLKKAAGRALAAFIFSGILCQVVKHLVGRPRPRLLDEGITHFGPTFASGLDSFPSGHTTTSVAVAFVLAWHYPRLAPVFMAWAAFVAAARMVGSSHYPLDVLGGIALGLAAGWVVIRLTTKRGSANTEQG